MRRGDPARLSIPVGVAAVGLAVLLGTLIGNVAGASGGALEEVFMRVTDLMLAFPTVILAMIISAALGAGIQNAVIAILTLVLALNVVGDSLRDALDPKLQKS